MFFLRPDVELRPGETGPALSRHGSGVSHSLSFEEALALSLLGHYGDVDVATQYLNACLRNRDGASLIDFVTTRWCTYLGEGTPRPLDLTWLKTFKASENRHSVLRAREAAPESISWLVTLTCNRRCPYCYYKVVPWNGDPASKPADASFPIRDAFRVVEEMASVGTANLYLTGGEPLLRPDLLEIAAHAVSLGIKVHINTRFAIDRALARAIAQAGVKDITFSLDSGNAVEANALSGNAGFFSEALSAIEALLSANIDLRVNAVITSVNVQHISKLLDLCVTLGVRRVTLSPYVEPVMTRRAPAALVRTGLPLGEIVADLKSHYGSHLNLAVGSAEAFQSSARVDCADRLLCEVGIRSLDILPDGRVTRCRYAPGDEDLIVGDLKIETLMEIWTGNALDRLTFPKPSAFGATACSTCSAHERCNTRGRCVLGARLNYGQLLAPDAGCNR
jgi:radical SAM protein with 4Fe4S-binding SPASM domain